LLSPNFKFENGGPLWSSPVTAIVVRSVQYVSVKMYKKCVVKKRTYNETKQNTLKTGRVYFSQIVDGFR
jgi:hypothetical protein